LDFQDPDLLNKVLKLRLDQVGNRLIAFFKDEGVNKTTGDIDWTRAGPFRLEYEDRLQPMLLTSVEYITGDSVMKRYKVPRCI
jgi:hypothetical protein